MASNQVMLVLFCGEIWSSLCAAAPQHAATSERHTCTTATGLGAEQRPRYQLQAPGPTLYQSDRSLPATEPQALPREEEAGDGSWVAALLMGIILLGTMVAVTSILLWKCCMRPALAESHWAGRSPFADGDTPDLLGDSDQATKRSSVLFMLPWRLKQGTHLQEDPSAPESPAQHTSSAGNGQQPPPATGSSGEGTAPTPAPAPADTAAEPCPPPDTAPEGSDLPPPPDWLREAPEEPSEHSAPHLDGEEPQPSPPELLIQETHETLPQPQHPL